MNLVITDNNNEMISQGIEIVNEKNTIYTEKVKSEIIKSISNHFPNCTKKEQEDHFYKSIYNYWAFGCSVDEYFYLGFYKKTTKEKNKYITHKKRLNLIYSINDYNLRHVCDDKYETYELLKRYFLRDVIKITGIDDLSLFKDFTKKHKDFVVKPNKFCGAVGVYFETIENKDAEACFKNILEKNSYADSIIIEELIVQDDALACFHPNSINAIRLTTVRRNNSVYILHPWIKVGANNTFVASAIMGGFDAGVDEKTGIIVTDGYGELGEIYKLHPNSKIKLKGYQIPKWKDLVKLSIKLANLMPTGINYIGWDFVLTPKGWCVMEANFSGDCMWQLYFEKGFLSEYEEVLGVPHSDKFWWAK